MDITYGTSAPSIVGLTPFNDFSFSVVQTPLLIAPSYGSAVTIKDATFIPTTSTGLTNNFEVISAHASQSITFSSLTPSVCSIDSQGNVARITDGLCQVQATCSLGTRAYSQVLSSGTNTVNIFSNFVSGSLGRHVSDAVATMLSGKTSGTTTQQCFSSYGGTSSSPIIVPNSSLFCSSLDLTGVSVMTGTNNDMFPWTLISPRHIIGATHVAYGSSPFVWRDASGVFHSANRTRGGTVYGDIYISYLDAPVTGVTPLKLLPSTWQTYLPSYTIGDEMAIDGYGNSTTYIPMIAKTFATSTARPWGDGYALAALGSAVDSRAAWETKPIGGDSSGPIFLAINGVPTLVSHWHTILGGPWYANFIPQINAAMNSLKDSGDSTVYAVNTVDLSGFSTF